MNRQQFFDQFKGVFNKEEILKISWAYHLAKKEHQKQKRDSGERYFEHCRRVALQVFCYPQLSGAPSVKEIIVSLLHDCVEDQFPPPRLIQTLFGEEIASGVDTLSKVTPVFDEATGKIIKKEKKDLKEYYQKIANSDIWIRRIKLCDRLDNLRSMDIWPKARQEKYIKETWEFIMPMALQTDRQLYEWLKKLLDWKEEKEAKNV